MAKVNFQEATKYPTEMTVTSPDGRSYEGFYTDPKIDRSTLPEGWNAYDIRHDDDGCGIFCQLCHNVVIVNNAGSFFLEGEIPELREPGAFVYFKVDPEEWDLLHADPDEIDDEDNVPHDPDCPENAVTDWDYSF